ncbi:MAG: purine-nucleoside phosphorylase [Bacteriovoracaceae bacterium]
MQQKLNKILNHIKSVNGTKPKVGIILGSGLGIYVERVENQTVIPYNEIPGFPETSVEGHEGKLILGQAQGVDVAVFQGRFHYYEGHSLEDVVLPARILSLLGAEFLILTNASGGINETYKPGELVCVKDHINMTGQNPLIGPNMEQMGPRFPDMTEAYDYELQELAQKAAAKTGLDIKRGVYAGVLGPTYETPAEIRMLRILGADLVGMSTVPEAIAANHMGLRVAGISCVTNMAAGIGGEKLRHEDVKLVAKQAMRKFSDLLNETVAEIGKL